MNRKTFLKKGIISGVGISITASGVFAQEKSPLPDELVKEFVIAGHGNLEKTSQMLEKEPLLLNVSWDWGQGDFEQAIEGAAHVGNREIALFLIRKGARMNLFTATMLGKLEIVKPMIEAFPDLINSKGPHSLSLLHHAEKGGDHAAEVLNFIQSRLG